MENQALEIECKAFCEQLQITYHDELLSYYEKGKQLMEQYGEFVLDKTRLIAWNERYPMFRIWFPEVLAAADCVREDETLLLHIYVLIALIQDDGDLGILEMPDRNRPDTDMAPLFSYLFFLEDMVRALEERGLPHQVIADTLNGFENNMQNFYLSKGRPGISVYYRWMIRWVRGTILRVGRLQFEMIREGSKVRVYRKGDDVQILMDGEKMHVKGLVFGSAGQTDEAGSYVAEIEEKGDTVTGYAVNAYGECVPEKVTLRGYREVFRGGDCAISVHIPPQDSFTLEAVKEAFVQALDIFEKYYPEFAYKAFVCHSWMMEKRLKEIMGRETNITRFADAWQPLPLLSQGEGVYSFLFHVPAQTAVDDLPENSSMQRKLKQYLQEGNLFYEKCGLLLPEEAKRRYSLGVMPVLPLKDR
jgi:hypothetical protein